MRSALCTNQAKRKFNGKMLRGVTPVEAARRAVLREMGEPTVVGVHTARSPYRIFLPKDESGYSAAPRPERKGLLPTFTSTCIAVDQNHDGEIASWESYCAENPLRIGDSMFVVETIAEDGTLRSPRAMTGRRRYDVESEGGYHVTRDSDHRGAFSKCSEVRISGEPYEKAGANEPPLRSCIPEQRKFEQHQPPWTQPSAPRRC